MDISEVIQRLEEKETYVLVRGPEIAWRSPDRAAPDPLDVDTVLTGPAWKPAYISELKKNEENWFFADIEFPPVVAGTGIAGTPALIYIRGWSPFTFWIDGEEAFREERPWHATGPIVDPVIRRIEPGRNYRLGLCLRPTELPAHFNPLNVSISYAALEKYDIEISAACLQLRFARELARTVEEKTAVARAANRLDLEALDNNQWDRFLSSVQEMEGDLERFRGRAREIRMHLVGHAHIDMDWMWTWEDTVHCIRRDFKAVTELQDDYPGLTFTHSQAPTYEVVKEMDSAVFEKVKKNVSEARWEYAAGTWVEGDLNMAGGESIARHMLYAQKWGRDNLGVEARVLWEPDTFGHPGNMPQLARLGGMNCYFHMRCNPGGHDYLPAWIWEGVDGAELPVFSCVYNSKLYPNDIERNLLAGMRCGLHNILFVWGVGDHGGGLSRHQLGILEQYRNKPAVPAIEFSTIARLLEAVEPEKVRLPRSKGSTSSLFEGCYSTHANMKRLVRRCEGALLTAETFSALAGCDSRDTLRKAWTDSLFNHFHDIFDGAAVHDAYEDAYRRAESSIRTAAGVENKALHSLVRPDKDGDRLVLLNQLGFSRTEPVKTNLQPDATGLVDSDGMPVPIQRMDEGFIFIAKNIPAFGAKTYRILSDPASKPALKDVNIREIRWRRDSEGCFEVETERAVALICRQSGAVCSYFDKMLGREFVGYGVPKPMQHADASRKDLSLNVFQVIDEAPNTMSAWLINDILKTENLLRGAHVEVVETGPVFARFRVTHGFRSSEIVEDMIFYNDYARVDFHADIDWREKGSERTGVPQLKVSFAAPLDAARAKYEGPFLVREEPADGLEKVSQTWADISGTDGGFAVFNDSRYGYDALGGRLRMTLLRNAYNPDPDSDRGRHIIRFAFLPHGAGMQNADLIRQAKAFNRPPAAVLTSDAIPENPALEIIGADTVVCTAMRIAEYSDRILYRFFETSGNPASARIRIGDGVAGAAEVDFLEKEVAASFSVNNGMIESDFRPFEVKTFLIDSRKEFHLHI